MVNKNEIYISVDIEASGPIPGEYSMLSIGSCVVGKVEQSFYAELKPLNDHFAEKAIQVAGLSMEALKEKGGQPAAVMAQFEEWVMGVSGDNRPVFVAFNATFDWSFTHWYFIKFLGHDPFGISGLDIKAYFMGKHHTTWNETVKKNVRKNYPSSTCHSHQALDDAKEQAEIFSRMLAK
jgi:DNA polymerase III alpha subunit (gram-positive type)